MKNIFLILVFSFVQLSGQIKFKTNFTITNKPLQLKELGKSTLRMWWQLTLFKIMVCICLGTLYY